MRYDAAMLRLPYRKLQIWQKSKDLTKVVYALTRTFPAEELYGLTTQLRRCAVSVPSNIAEGSQRRTNREFVNFLHIARGSLAELETQLIIASDLAYLSKQDFAVVLSSLQELKRMLHVFTRKVAAAPEH